MHITGSVTGNHSTEEKEWTTRTDAPYELDFYPKNNNSPITISYNGDDDKENPDNCKLVFRVYDIENGACKIEITNDSKNTGHWDEQRSDLENGIIYMVFHPEK